jgi:hypothetical protein
MVSGLFVLESSTDMSFNSWLAKRLCDFPSTSQFLACGGENQLLVNILWGIFNRLSMSRASIHTARWRTPTGLERV